MSNKPRESDQLTNTRSQRLLRPPLRWAGGKSVIIKKLIPLMPSSYHRFVEPMAGSAALFFGVQPGIALLADVNEELVNYYTVLRDSPELLITSLFQLSASKDTYYNLREIVPVDPLERAVRFAYLNRLCWNGVYRVNQSGKFNVPIGSRLPQVLWNEKHLRLCSRALANADLSSGTVQDTLKKCKSNDFVFIDPPYPKGANNGIGFNRYTTDKFTIVDHQTLAQSVIELALKGTKIMVVISADKQLLNLYKSNFRKIKLSTKSLIACTGSGRGPVSEIVLCNY